MKPPECLARDARGRAWRRRSPLAAGATAVLLPLLFAGCGRRFMRHGMISAEVLDGTTYLLLEQTPVFSAGDESTFGIYRCVSSDFSRWEPLVENRVGPVFGTFIYRDASGVRLGVFHPNRVTLFRFGAGGAGDEVKVTSEFRLLSFDWWAETGALIGHTTYVFGVNFQDRGAVSPPPPGRLSVARFDGEHFEELFKIAKAPRVKRQSFWMKAVPHQGRIHIFWRGATIHPGVDLEPPVSFRGPLQEALFDGRRFSPRVRSIPLPAGFTVVWSDGKNLRAAVQPQDRAFGRSPPPRLFTLSASGGAPVETPIAERPPHRKLGFKYYAIERIQNASGEAFLRTNSQRLQVWRAGSAGWGVRARPAGLPENNLEYLFFGALGGGVLMVGGGLGLAYRRRRYLRALAGKLGPHDVLAPLPLRLSAYLIDVAVLIGATEAVTRWAGLALPRWSGLLLDFQIRPVFFFLYMGYLVLAERAGGLTLGKFFLGLRVITDKGERPSFWSAFVRNLFGFYERHPLLAPFAALPTVLLTPRHQRMGDLLAHTLVVQKTAMERYRTERAAQAAERWRLDSGEKQTDGTEQPEAAASVPGTVAGRREQGQGTDGPGDGPPSRGSERP